VEADGIVEVREKGSAAEGPRLKKSRAVRVGCTDYPVL
jgi:hypothetical protein